MPPPLPPTDRTEEPLDAIPVLTGWVRGTLLGIAIGLTAVFGIAAWLKPYDAGGQALKMETHRQMGLPP